MKKFYQAGLTVSRKTQYCILDYYKKLYINYEVQNVGEIAKNCDMCTTTIYNFLDLAIREPDVSGKFDSITKLILLCTKFKGDNKYFEMQQLLADEIRRRKYEKLVKEYIKKENSNDSRDKLKK